MNRSVEVVAEKLNCDYETAREFCFSVQDYFAGSLPSFKIISKVVNQEDVRNVKPKTIALRINETQQSFRVVNKPRKRRERKFSDQNFRITPATPKINKSNNIKSMGWIDSPIKKFTVDESGVLVHPGSGRRRKKSRLHRGPVGAVIPSSDDGPGDFEKLRQNFKEVDQRNRKRKKDKRVSRRKGDSYVQCLRCRSKVKYKNMKRHMKTVHDQVISNKDLRSLGKVKPPKKSSRRGQLGRRRKHADHTKEKFDDSVDEARFAGKYLGFMRREGGKFGSLPLYDDHGDESSAN